MPKFVVLPHFKRQLKPLIKKYRDLANAIIQAAETFKPNLRDHLGDDVYKIRFTTPSLRRGKSGSFRLIMLVVEIDDLLIPVTVYFKGGRESITQKELGDHLQRVYFELKNRERD